MASSLEVWSPASKRDVRSLTPDMPRVTFLIGGLARTFEFDASSLPYQHHGLRGSLLDVALNFGVPLEHVCGGNCACTTCHVIIRSGMEHLSSMADNEADRLDTAWDLRPESRLACQAIVTGDVVCEVPAYTRNYVQESGKGVGTDFGF